MDDEVAVDGKPCEPPNEVDLEIGPEVEGRLERQSLKAAKIGVGVGPATFVSGRLAANEIYLEKETS